MHRAAHNFAILGKDGFNISLGDQQRVQVPNEDAGVEGARVILVGDVAAGHQAGDGRPTTDGSFEGKINK